MDIGSLLVGAALAVAGGVIGQLVSFWLKQVESKRNYRRDKLDELMISFCEDEHWINDYRRALCYGDAHHSTSEPFDRVEANVHLYLRGQLLPALLALLETRTLFKEKMGLVYIDRLDRAMGAGRVTTTLPDPNKIADVQAAHQPYYQALLAFRSNCASAAKRFA